MRSPISAAATVKQALALINAQAFDAAMLDLNLNGDRSFPVADALARRGVPFVFSTGYGADGLTDSYRDRPLLRKPYRHEELAKIFESLVPADPMIAVAFCREQANSSTGVEGFSHRPTTLVSYLPQLHVRSPIVLCEFLARPKALCDA